MNDYNPPTPIKATIIQMPAEKNIRIHHHHHANAPGGRTHTLTLKVPIILEIHLSPDQFKALISQAA